MATNKLTDIFASLESIKHIDSSDKEFWFARELGPLLGYVRWDTFEGVIKKAATAAANSGVLVDNHFSDLRKMVSIGYGNDREIADVALTRYACYLVAQNAHPGKPEVAAAQTYFAIQTRKQEVDQQNSEEIKRIEARAKLSETEKKFSGILNERQVNSKGIAEIRSSGDQILFGGYSTKQMKDMYGVVSAKPLADFLPTITLKAKDLATEMTSINSIQNELSGKESIKHEHGQNNRSVREALVSRGIKPERLAPQEDINKVKRRVEKVRKELTNGA